MAQKKKRKTTRRKGKYQHEEVLTRLDTYCISLREYYLSLRRAGFPVDQALGMCDKNTFPDWLIPTNPDFDPVNPDHDPYEDED
jgi:hypothetical protein